MGLVVVEYLKVLLFQVGNRAALLIAYHDRDNDSVDIHHDGGWCCLLRISVLSDSVYGGENS